MSVLPKIDPGQENLWGEDMVEDVLAPLVGKLSFRDTLIACMGMGMFGHRWRNANKIGGLVQLSNITVHSKMRKAGAIITRANKERSIGWRYAPNPDRVQTMATIVKDRGVFMALITLIAMRGSTWDWWADDGKWGVVRDLVRSWRES